VRAITSERKNYSSLRNVCGKKTLDKARQGERERERERDREKETERKRHEEEE